jgi:hypothetical protein
MMILFDSAKSHKAKSFGRGLLRSVPQSNSFEPSDADRAWAAQAFAADGDVSARLQHIANRAAKAFRQHAECGTSYQRREQILNGRSAALPPISGGAPVEPTSSDWAEYAAWSAKLEAIYGGIDYEPRSSRISDEDVASVNAVG